MVIDDGCLTVVWALLIPIDETPPPGNPGKICECDSNSIRHCVYCSPKVCAKCCNVARSDGSVAVIMTPSMSNRADV